MGRVRFMLRCAAGLAVAATLAHGCCPNACSSNGECKTPLCTCKCKSGFYGGDCSLRTCPTGTAWAHYITDTDQGHKLAECSNMGKCDRTSGTCDCIFGFTGDACQRKMCPNNCNGHGSCVSHREYAEMKDPGYGALTFHSPGYRKYDRGTNTYHHEKDDIVVAVYEDVWDADMLHKCICDGGYQGVDCAQKVCPFGDDPLTGTLADPAGLQYDETQTITCRADSGSFSIQFRGLIVGHFERQTADINHDDSSSTLQAKLEALPAIGAGGVSVSIAGGGDSVCAGTAVTTTVTFMRVHGDVPVMRADTTKLGYYGITDKGLCAPATTSSSSSSSSSSAALRPTATTKTKRCPPCADAQLTQAFCDASITAANFQPYIRIVTTTTGTKENLPCSGRGLCDIETSICTCGNGLEFGISDGYGAKPDSTSVKSIADCGNIILAPYDCPGEIGCSGHGLCKGSPTFNCVCAVGWMGSDCSERTCAKHKAWVSLPSSNGVSHQEEECAGMGGCYRSKGFCQCSNGFEGAACERLVCPGTPICSGHGACRTQDLLAEGVVANQGEALRGWGLKVADTRDVTYGTDPSNRHTWDAAMVQGCDCDPGFTGIDCSTRSCPKGEDPGIPGGGHEVQSIVCEATVGLFSLKFRGFETVSLDYQTSAAELKAALEALPSIGRVSVVNDRVRKAKERLNSDEYNATLTDEDGNVVGGLDDNGDGIADITWDSILPCITCDAMHKCTKQHPCRRLDTVCSFTGNNEVLVEYLTELGDVPNVSPVLKRYASSVIRVDILSDGKGMSVKGTRKPEVCSNRGACDTETGQCRCDPGFASSDGNKGPGGKGDCGHKMAEGAITFHSAGPGS